MANPRETLRDVRRVSLELRLDTRDATNPRRAILNIQGPHRLVLLDVINLRLAPDLRYRALGELACVTLEGAVVDVLEPTSLSEEGILLVEGGVVGKDVVGSHAILEHNDVRVLDGLGGGGLNDGGHGEDSRLALGIVGGGKRGRDGGGSEGEGDEVEHGGEDVV